jgi:hypothetical protein
MRHRDLKSKIHALLCQTETEGEWQALLNLPARQVVNPLFSLLYSGDELVKWRAVTALGLVTARLAEAEIEAARVVMRRLMWNLNDESGGIGWGSPEAMAEIMARCPRLAEEYACILISYADPAGNFLEHDLLQRGVLWGLGRLAETWPNLARPGGPFLFAYFSSTDPNLRGLAVWAAGQMADANLRGAIALLCSDPTQISLFLNGKLAFHPISHLAGMALARMDAACAH